MSNYFDDDDAFWDEPSFDPDRTSQIERVRRRSPERTRTHHVVRREQPLEHLDDESTMWVEPAPRIAERLGPLGAVDPRVLSVGAVALAVVLAVPLFGALGDDGNGDALRTIEEQSTTTVTTIAAPNTTDPEVVVVTAAVDPDISGDTDVGESSAGTASTADEDERRCGDGPAGTERDARLRQPVHGHCGGLLVAHRRWKRNVARLAARCQRGDGRDTDLSR